MAPDSPPAAQALDKASRDHYALLTADETRRQSLTQMIHSCSQICFELPCAHNTYYTVISEWHPWETRRGDDSRHQPTENDSLCSRDEHRGLVRGRRRPPSQEERASRRGGRSGGQVRYRPVERMAFTTVYAALRPSKWNVLEQEMLIAKFIFIIN